jgi:hypothetical protein
VYFPLRHSDSRECELDAALLAQFLDGPRHGVATPTAGTSAAKKSWRAIVPVTLPKPVMSGMNVKGRFGKQDFRYVAKEDIYICPTGQKLGKTVHP